MSEFDLQRVALPTGVELDVAVAGDPATRRSSCSTAFPNRTARGAYQIPELAKDHFVLAPDQRGFARSSKPDGVENYTPDKTGRRPARAGRPFRDRATSRSSATTGAARSRGWRRCSIRTASSV